MARKYQLGFFRIWANHLVHALLRLSLGPLRTYLLTVRGRKTGLLHSTPVTLVEENFKRWLVVAPYGEVNWVKNARLTGNVMFSRGRHTEIVTTTELQPNEAALVLKKYVLQVPITEPFFDVTPQSSIDDYVAEALKHPVFQIRSHGRSRIAGSF